MTRIALVHDMLVQEGGQERVLRALQELFPDAPTFVLVYDEKKRLRFYEDKDIRSTFLQKMPMVQQKYQWYLPLMAAAIESYDLKDFDIVLSSSSSFAKGVITGSATKHICYCHTPTRYLWSEAKGYVEDLHYPDLVKKVLPLYLSWLRNWDWTAAQRIDYFLCNSKTVSQRIKRFYNCDSKVIYPPVDTHKFYINNNSKKDYYLIGGRLVAYKRYDLAIEAFNKLNMPLKVFGVGPEFWRLKKMAKGNVKFLGEVTESKKSELYANCLAFINPQEEDFGITAIEAMASGRPVIAYNKGGAQETVTQETGEFFEEQNWEDLANTIIHFKPERYSPLEIKEYAEKFNKESFKKEIREFVEWVSIK